MYQKRTSQRYLSPSKLTTKIEQAAIGCPTCAKIGSDEPAPVRIMAMNEQKSRRRANWNNHFILCS